MKNKLGVISIVVFGLALFVFGIGMYVQSNYETEEARLAAEIQELETVIEESHSSHEAEVKKLYSVLTEVDSDRYDKDIATINEFLSSSFSWESWSEYMFIRNDLMERYKLDDTNMFIGMFFPEVGNLQMSDGVNYNRIDTNGLRMEYLGYDASCIKIENMTYTYLCNVKWRWYDDTGLAASSSDLVLVTVNGDGEIIDLEGYLLYE